MNSFAVSSGSASTTSVSSQPNAFALTAGVAFSTIAAAGAVSGRYSSRWLPDNNVPMVNDDKTCNAAWYRFFDEIGENRLGGIAGPTIGTVSSMATAAVDTATSAAVQGAAIAQAVNTNAATAIATTQVLKASGAVGASQIPNPTQVQY